MASFEPRTLVRRRFQLRPLEEFAGQLRVGVEAYSVLRSAIAGALRKLGKHARCPQTCRADCDSHTRALAGYPLECRGGCVAVIERAAYTQLHLLDLVHGDAKYYFQRLAFNPEIPLHA